MLPVKTTERDSFGYRLIQVRKKLNDEAKKPLQALAEEFNVSLRAIQRDLQERFAFLQLEKTKGRYHLHPAFRQAQPARHQNTLPRTGRCWRPVPRQE